MKAEEYSSYAAFVAVWRIHNGRIEFLVTNNTTDEIHPGKKFVGGKGERKDARYPDPVLATICRETEEEAGSRLFHPNDSRLRLVNIVDKPDYASFSPPYIHRVFFFLSPFEL